MEFTTSKQMSITDFYVVVVAVAAAVVVFT